MDILLVAIGGAIGAAGRYLISLLVVNTNSPFPLGALIVNLVGSFLLGFTVSLSTNDQWLLGTGVLGGFTTFSTFSVEAATLYKKSISLFIVYVLLTILGSILLFSLAFSL
ncbi:fluoride efflux transporter FluC [Bacillus sp. FJAT-42315]|uniref:fluoride efflux transporter FluC n=1 Tax=Bacillus sp. FJAT-42315 TaxID=2014077 RepID=UPI0018E27935|nr:CrcB family protein [Bacillus sp. FJAT-42315]